VVEWAWVVDRDAVWGEVWGAVKAEDAAWDEVAEEAEVVEAVEAWVEVAEAAEARVEILVLARAITLMSENLKPRRRMRGAMLSKLCL